MRSHRLSTAAVLLMTLAACSDGSPEPEVEQTVNGSPSSAAAEAAGSRQSLELTDEGEPRRYDVYAPPDIDATGPAPLVVVLPGTNVALEDLERTTGFDLLADEEGFLVVYVDSREGTFDARLCCNGTDRDVAFVQAVIADVAAELPVDPTRVYAAGFSAGAAMSYKLAVSAPETFAAVAPVSGGFYPDPGAPAPEAIVPDPAPSVITFAGGADPDFDDILAGTQLWRLGAGCDSPTDSSVSGGEGLAVSAAECADGSTVAVYTVQDMGHAWPGGAEGGFGDPDAGLDATRLIWDFFSTLRRR